MAALRLGDHDVPSTNQQPWTISAAETDEELLAKLAAIYVSPISKDSEYKPDELTNGDNERDK